MSRDRRRWEEAGSSHWQPLYARSRRDELSRGNYAPPADFFLPTRSFNYWRDETWVPTPSHPQSSYGRENYDEQWRDDGRTRYADASSSRQRRDVESARGWDYQEPRRERSPPRQNSVRQHYSTYAPQPYIPRPTFHARGPVGSMPPPSRPVPTGPSSWRASPPPKEPPRLPDPSPRYLALSSEPSEILQDAPTSRKLLVLDLNGTLLVRSARSRSSSGPQLRSVQQRPCMQSFRQYLFCPETKAWLDTMVWSSAQPHSVDHMVDRVFGPTKSELKAVWNRRGLGLSDEEYRQNTVTMKDLTKTWKVFTSTPGPEKLEGHSDSTRSKTMHSAFTTLLLDDSPHKAALQPYNHVCIPEYDKTRRQHDLRSLLATREAKKGKQSQKNQVKTATGPAVAGPSLGGAPSEFIENEPYDTILLAIIGVLDAVKSQSNVAGWIRRGGLWGTQREAGASDVKSENGVVPSGNDASNTPDPEQAHLQTKMWFDDASVVADWVGRGRRALRELGIEVVYGVTD